MVSSSLTAKNSTKFSSSTILERRNSLTVLHTRRLNWNRRVSISFLVIPAFLLSLSGKHLEQLQGEQRQLSDVVKTQNLSPEEVLQMTTDHETLSRNLEDLKQKISETHRTIMNLEVNVTNRASAAEEAVEAYTNLLLDLFPEGPFSDVDLSLELNTASSNPLNLLVGADLRKVIKPTLSGIAESKRAERATVESERIKVDNELDQLSQECENREEEIHELDRKIAALNEQADDLRDVCGESFSVACH
jgi:kinetochore protein NDC80